MLKPETDVLVSQLDRVLSEHVARGIVGASLALVRPGEEVLTLAAGCANRATGAPLTPDHLFKTASTKKTWTAVAVLALVSEGADRPRPDHRGVVPPPAARGRDSRAPPAQSPLGPARIRGVHAQGRGRRLDARADRRLRARQRHADRARRGLHLLQPRLRAGGRDRRQRAGRGALPVAQARGVRAGGNGRDLERRGRGLPARAAGPSIRLRFGAARRAAGGLIGLVPALRHRGGGRPGHHAARSGAGLPCALHRAGAGERRPRHAARPAAAGRVPGHQHHPLRPRGAGLPLRRAHDRGGTWASCGGTSPWPAITRRAGSPPCSARTRAPATWRRSARRGSTRPSPRSSAWPARDPGRRAPTPA